MVAMSLSVATVKTKAETHTPAVLRDRAARSGLEYLLWRPRRIKGTGIGEAGDKSWWGDTQPTMNVAQFEYKQLKDKTLLASHLTNWDTEPLPFSTFSFSSDALISFATAVGWCLSASSRSVRQATWLASGKTQSIMKDAFEPLLHRCPQTSVVDP